MIGCGETPGAEQSNIGSSRNQIGGNCGLCKHKHQCAAGFGGCGCISNSRLEVRQAKVLGSFLEEDSDVQELDTGRKMAHLRLAMHH